MSALPRSSGFRIARIALGLSRSRSTAPHLPSRRRRNSRHRLAPARREEDLHRQPRSSKAFSRPRSAPNTISPAGSTASGNTTCRCGCSPTAPRADRKAQLAKVVADIARAGSASRHRHDREQRRRQCRGQAGARPRSAIAPSRPSTAASGRARSAPRSIRNACPAFARTRNSRSSIPT